ncbi:hypothetical protein QJS10_CPA09g01305 [Acorus calamus]|uniref:Uncharacterized protein n=1 Tax=Acorus calamus TaxID=4465 RepID=A0AAV9E5Y0_ACOCL|nr:hypothetical protein QJS10_CPA09g01305 [Acorus calamus]
MMGCTPSRTIKSTTTNHSHPSLAPLPTSSTVHHISLCRNNFSHFVSFTSSSSTIPYSSVPLYPQSNGPDPFPKSTDSPTVIDTADLMTENYLFATA